MNDLQEQLAALRERVARVNARFSEKYSEPPQHAPEPHEQRLPETLPGQVVETAHGSHWETETLYASHRQHGSADVGALSDLPHDLLAAISEGEAPSSPPAEWAFLDTETTGLAGGTGTCAFLVGVGRITPEGFRVRQFFMRDYGEEASLLAALAEHLAPFRVLITYNGRTFDQPLLETRYRMNRARPPFAKMAHHVDLLYGARRLWKLRYESCRLVDLETQVLGFEREGDVPGSLIPFLYFEYLRTRQSGRLQPVFEHNAIDILTLACLTGIVPHAFKDNSGLQHGAEIVGMARWILKTGEPSEARALFARAVDAGLPDALLFKTLWEIAALDRKLGADDQAVTAWTELATARNPYRMKALEELAKHEEHRAKNPARALEWTRAALEHEDTPELRHREQRLLRKHAPGTQLL
ncbi:MAG: ribonuclease H-like domain-containing protein [Bryobacteraceae bacterium]